MSSDDLIIFPFTAVAGMEEPKKAILCSLIDGKIKTVLIRGGTGSAKSTLCRSVRSISEKKVINIPLNVTEEQLFGGMDIEATVKEGKAVVQKGLLSRADGNILYLDDANLLDQNLLAGLLDCVLQGRVLLEREGISAEYDCNTTLIATMNPVDSDISPHMLDRFDVCAYIRPLDDMKEDILRMNMEFSDDPRGFMEKYRAKEEELSAKIGKAKKLLQYVTISDELMEVAVELVSKVFADGHRGDIALIRTACALAALDYREEVTRQDIEDAAMICLPHRRNYVQPPPPPEEPPEEDEPPEDENKDDDRDDKPPEQEDEPPEQPPEDNDDEKQDKQPPSLDELRDMLDDMMFEIGEEFRVIDYLSDGKRRIRTTASKKGRRQIVESSDATGRYARSRISDDVHDIAFDATIRAAAPYQKDRDHEGLTISIHKDDIREKVRERRAGCTIMFLVDASGSLGVRKRMSAVKGAVLSMLKDSYVRRDRVGLMAFRRDGAELILPPTRSVEYSYKKLEDLPTGGRTPLSEALVTIEEFMTSYSRTHQGELCYIVVITDGRANVPLKEGTDANEEVLELARKMSIPQVRWIVIDASAGYIRFDNAERLAMELEGTYFKLEDLNADRLAESVRAAIDR